MCHIFQPRVNGWTYVLPVECHQTIKWPINRSVVSGTIRPVALTYVTLVWIKSCDFYQGMMEAEEDKLLALKDFMLKSNKAKANIIDQSHLSDGGHSGVIDLGTLGITGRQVDLIKPKQEFEDKRGGWHSVCIHIYCYLRICIHFSLGCH